MPNRQMSSLQSLSMISQTQNPKYGTIVGNMPNESINFANSEYSESVRFNNDYVVDRDSMNFKKIQSMNKVRKGVKN